MSSTISPKNSTPIFLDVDTSIVENNLHFMKDSNEDEFNKLFGSNRPSYPSKLVKPFPEYNPQQVFGVLYINGKPAGVIPRIGDEFEVNVDDGIDGNENFDEEHEGIEDYEVYNREYGIFFMNEEGAAGLDDNVVHIGVEGFCVKTKEVGSEKKVFINICYTDAIPPPKEVTESELAQIIESESPGDYRVPMSLGEIHSVKDKKGLEAKACDIAIHPQFLKKVEGSQAFKNFFMAVVFQGLENKYGLVCADEKIILKNIKAYGNLQMHRVQQREIEEKMGKSGERSLIEEITHAKEGDKKQVTIETLSSTENGVRQPEYRLYKKKDGQNCLIGQFKLPDVISATELTLDVGEDRILLESKIRGYLLDIFIPYIVKQKTCSSSFDRTSKILTVTMPLVGG